MSAGRVEGPRLTAAALHPGNLHPTGGELRRLDFEDGCRGPVGYDLALMRWMDPDRRRRLGQP
jgi:hypothetical protein